MYSYFSGLPQILAIEYCTYCSAHKFPQLEGQGTLGGREKKMRKGSKRKKHTPF